MIHQNVEKEIKWTEFGVLVYFRVALDSIQHLRDRLQELQDTDGVRSRIVQIDLAPEMED